VTRGSARCLGRREGDRYMDRGGVDAEDGLAVLVLS
jgi:hypothetical protein